MNIPGIPVRPDASRLFRETYEKYYPVVLKHLFFLTGANPIHEDVAHEVFLKFWEAGPETIEYPGAWLCKVAGNLTLNAIRSNKRRENREESIMEATKELMLLEDAVIRTEEVQRVRTILKDLSEEQRTCLIMKFSGYSYSEIHQATGIPKGNIGQYIARGKSRFTELYRKAGGSDVLR